jgi:dolichyl-phosphate-mannose--protein O-mannosyl transferase
MRIPFFTGITGIRVLNTLKLLITFLTLPRFKTYKLAVVRKFFSFSLLIPFCLDQARLIFQVRFSVLPSSCPSHSLTPSVLQIYSRDSRRRYKIVI